MFTTTTDVRFAHVDPAGIVFYPRYLEMLNGAVEDWFGDAIGSSFAELHIDRRVGTPTVHLEVDFKIASRLGERLDISITPLRLGKSSCRIAVDFSCKDELRLSAELVLVCTDLDTLSSTPWPDDLRAGIERQLVPAS